MLLNTQQIVFVLNRMADLIPDAKSELDYEDPFHMLVAVMLSAQATDRQVNKVTPALFERFKTPAMMAEATAQEIEPYIKSLGLYRNKAKFLQQTATKIMKEFHGQVPNNLSDLITLPGVGRKTANVILSVVFDIPAIAVDTHVERVSKRLQFVSADANPLQVEKELMEKIPEDMWSHAHQLLVLFGRYYSTARSTEDFEHLGLSLEEVKKI